MRFRREPTHDLVGQRRGHPPRIPTSSRARKRSCPPKAFAIGDVWLLKYSATEIDDVGQSGPACVGQDLQLPHRRDARRRRGGLVPGRRVSTRAATSTTATRWGRCSCRSATGLPDTDAVPRVLLGFQRKYRTRMVAMRRGNVLHSRILAVGAMLVCAATSRSRNGPHGSCHADVAPGPAAPELEGDHQGLGRTGVPAPRRAAVRLREGASRGRTTTRRKDGSRAPGRSSRTSPSRRPRRSTRRRS